mmetsp:Transcript_1824/g.3060  ORF Transcript_1824/g.3060 Transcript_1824/m.3060 type:complete len:411 (-) Transcript_1824:1081-2313(-)|eukprot:CAMPEP_0203746054 /NCGR_PEP_ID=MMETSP0098-20131031/1606_1 /ASSEMBLY_ACC=CAM_ASM_000208 /TAXON_ID=96639 /ORGANISM=" , Strain NY0313808BC1" /LENGTH=410 /DNA_ID=CAMNT_0050634013 /DNA_START=731 /DNA_END=1963 /DNA_ORIENTATION=+
MECCGLRLRPAWNGPNGQLGQSDAIKAILGKDLCVIVEQSNLPTEISKLHNVKLTGKFMVQVNSASDIRKSLRSIQKGEEEKSKNTSNGRGNNYPTEVAQNARMLKIELTDGIQSLFALEYKPIKELEGLVGEKLILENVPVKRGLLLLEPSNVKSLGGELPRTQDEPMVAENRINVTRTPGNKRVFEEMRDRTSLHPTATVPRANTQPSRQNVSEYRRRTAFERAVPSNNAERQPSSRRDAQTQNSTTSLVTSPSVSSSSAPRNVESASGEKYAYIDELKLGETGLVKAVITDISSFSTTNGMFNLIVEISDGVGVCKSLVDSNYCERHLIHLTPKELQLKKKTSKPEYKNVMGKASKKLQKMEGLLKMKRTSDAVPFIILDLLSPSRDESYSQHLLRQVQGQLKHVTY